MNINVDIDPISAIAGALVALLFVWLNRVSKEKAAPKQHHSDDQVSIDLYLVRTKNSYSFSQSIPNQSDPVLVSSGKFVFQKRADAYNFYCLEKALNARDLQHLIS